MRRLFDPPSENSKPSVSTQCNCLTFCWPLEVSEGLVAVEFLAVRAGYKEPRWSVEKTSSWLNIS